MTTPTPDQPTLFDCRRNRHKVIGLTPNRQPDGICVICGARNAIDARRLPPLPAPPTRPQDPTALAASAPILIPEP